MPLVAAGVLPIPGIPVPIPIPSDPFTLVNPFKWINDQIHNLLIGLVTFFQNVLVNPPQPKGGSWQDYLYGNSLGLTYKLTIYVTILTIVVGMFWHKRLRSVPHALLVAIVVGLGGAFWFEFCNWLIAVGNQLSQMAMFYQSPSAPNSPLLDLPNIGNVFGSMAGFSIIGGTGLVLVAIVFIYLILAILITFAIPPVFALSPMSSFTQRLFERLVSVGLVVMVFGRPAAIFCMEIGKIAADNLPLGYTSAGASFYLWASMIMGILAQWFLLSTTQKVVSRVSGGFIRSTVTGQVTTRSEQQVKVDMTHATNSHVGNVVRDSVAISSFRAGSRRLANSIKDEAGERTSRALQGAAVATAVTNPVASVGLSVAGKFAHRPHRDRTHSGSNKH